jgi:hypothetical protein
MKRMKNLFFGLLGLLFLISCGKPNDPEVLIPPDISGGYKIVKSYQTSGWAQDVLKKDSLLYIAQGEGGLLILNVTNPENPQVVSTTTDFVKGYCSKIIKKDSVVYMAAGTFGINVLDVADPLAPYVSASNLNVKPARNFYILGDFLYTAISEQGIGICNISYPTQPDIRGTIYTIGYAYDLFVTSDTLRIIAACGEMGLSIYDISAIENGYGVYHAMGWCDTPGNAEALVVEEDQSLAFLACGTAGLQILDYADTANIHIVGSYDGAGYAKDLVKDGNKIYMATELSGLQVIDVTNIAAPFLIGSVDTEYALSLDFDDKYIYLADDIAGLVIFSIPD